MRHRLGSETHKRIAATVLGALIIAGVFSVSTHNRPALASSETRFSEHTSGGLQVVPASCPSSPHYIGECNPTDINCSLSVAQRVVMPSTANTVSWYIAPDPIWGGMATTLGTLTPVGVMVTSSSGNTAVAPTQTTTYQMTGSHTYFGFTTSTFSCQNTIVVCTAGQVVQNGACVTACSDGLPQNSDGSCTRCGTGFTYDNTVHACVCTSGGAQDLLTPSCTCPDGQAMNSDNTCTRCVSPYTYSVTTHACVCTGPSCVSVCPDNLPPNSDGSCTRCYAPTPDYDPVLKRCVCSSGSCGGTILNPDVKTWQVRPLLVRSGNTVSVSWDVANVQSCTVTGSNGDSWSGISGNQTSSPITGQTIYRLSCTPLAGASGSPVNKSTTVNIVPIFNEP